MRQLTRPDLYAYAAGALDPGRCHDVEQELASSLALRAELAEAERRLAPPPPATRWTLPPPGWSDARFAVTPLHADVMGAPIRPGDRFRVRVDDAAPDAIVVVLVRVDDAWNVVCPRDPDEVFQVRDLPDGELHLVAQATPGAQRWALVLVEPPLDVDWAAEDPWAGLADDVACGRRAALTWVIEVTR